MEEKRFIFQTIKIFDRYNKLYQKISNGRYKDYITYISRGRFADEDELIKPKLWIDFLESVLGFPKDEYIPELLGTTGRKPDFIPRDLRVHPFIFEIKGTDSESLQNHYPQIVKYIKTPVKWGVITNMRDLLVFETSTPFPIQDYSFSFLQFYKDHKSHPKEILDFPNTKRFLAFIKRFKLQELSLQDKIEKIKEAKPWTGRETLNPDELIKTIRKVTRFLVEDAKQHKNRLSVNLRFDPRTKESIAQEIETIACELDRSRTPQKIDTKSLDRLVSAKPGAVEFQAFETFFSRVAYFVMTRLLLARMWEDIGFIDQSLYNGGFERWYETFNRQIEKVLEYAFNLAGKRYSWLYHIPNNYSWYTPSERTLIEVLYEFSNYNLGKLNTDVLGTVYEEYVDRIDRKNKGQYYTPREIISLIWDRVGFTNDDAFFRFKNGKRKPKLVFDPVTGSGGFLVEAARRMREESHYNDKDVEDLFDIFMAIVYGLQGGEINLFAHYITEVNLLIQLTPIIKNILDVHKHLYKVPGFTLSLVPCDSLGLHNPYSYLKNEAEEGMENKDHVIEILDPQKRDIYQRIKKSQDFDYVCANPPYIGEKGHKELFHSTIERFPYWRRFYQGKMDYLYFFVILGLSKLREGGKLGFITTSYWLTADGASKFREYILENTLIKEIIDFGETKLFKGAPGQHNMVFILEKCSSYEEAKTMVKTKIPENIAKKEKNRIKIVKVKSIYATKMFDKSNRYSIKNLTDHIQKHIDKKEYSDEYIDVLYSAVKQGELTEGAWNLGYSTKLNIILDEIEKRGEKIGSFLHIGCGVLTNRDNVNTKNIKRLTQSEIERYKIKLGDGIFVLSEEEFRSLSLSSKERKLIKRWYKNSEVSRYIPDPHKGKTFLIYLRNKDNLDEYPTIKAHLMKFKGILDYQLLGYGETNKWYAVTRASEDSVLKKEKLFTPYRAEKNTFAYLNTEFFSSKDLYYITYQIEPPNVGESLKYILAILNSSITEFWCVHKLKQKGNVREYYATPLKNTPIRRIDFENPKEVKIHNEIVKKVDEIIKIKKKLAGYNKFFTGVRLTRLEKFKDVPGPDPIAITKSLPPQEQRILRTHPEIKIELPEPIEFYLAKIGKIEEATPLFTRSAKKRFYSLEFIGKGKKRLSITAPEEVIQYLKQVLSKYKGKPFEEIKEILMPRDMKTYETKKKQILREVGSLLTRIAILQTQIDNMVYKLYGINEEERKVIEST